MILLSTKAGLRAKEIAMLEWGMVTDAEGAVGDAIHLENRASKGRRGGRTIPLNTNLREALMGLKAARGDIAAPHRRVIHSERADGYSAAAVQVWFGRLYGKLGFASASSHSGRRTFITQAARWQLARCPGARRACEPRDNAAIHPGRHRGEAEGGSADVSGTLARSRR